MRGDANRRQFLTFTLAAATVALARPAIVRASTAPAAQAGERAIAFHNLHTGERLKTVYWADGAYLREGLQEIDHLMRDFRTGEVERMDPKLMDILYVLRGKLDSTAPFQLISGYRSPKTNAMLRQRSSGVAKRSLHMQGRAADVYLPGRDLKTLRKAALALKAGGVGYYPKPGFVHLDTGRVRFW
jgi:uncharacterized protein YcbK (DUF882 family)